MRKRYALDRKVELEIVSADMNSVLNKCANLGITIENVAKRDILTARVTVAYRSHLTVIKMLEEIGCSVRVINRSKILLLPTMLINRPLLILFALLMFLVSILLQGRILFVDVSGNDEIPARLILEYARQCGIQFGSKKNTLRSELVKNYLLNNLPQLKWAGVNIKGCTAIIMVEEGGQDEEKNPEKNTVSGIYAARDGVIQSVTVTKGSPVCGIGDSVIAGELLISGFTDCGYKLLAENAEGEVTAFTRWENDYVAPVPAFSRGKIEKIHRCYSLKIGKKVIKLCNHSGILDATCVKMYLEDYWTFPGNYELPMSLICQEYHFYEMEPWASSGNSLPLWVTDEAERYIQTQMIAGEILDADLACLIDDGCYRMQGVYSCKEMIGRVKYEENFREHAEDYRKNSER